MGKRSSAKKSGANKTDLQSLLRNRNVLYVVLFFSVINLFSYLMMKQLDAVAFFIIIGFLATYFSKNMIIVMLTSVVSTFLLVQINLLGKVQEGMEGMEEGTTDSSGNEINSNSETSSEDTTTEDKKETVQLNPINTSDIPINGEMREALTSIKDKKGAEGMKTKEGKEKFTQKLNPARYNADDDDTTPRHKPKIDYSATLESAYDNLDKLLSSDAIKNMSNDTGRLAEKQKQLMDNIGKLTPIMDKASSVLSNLDMGGISGLMSGIQDRMKGFGKDTGISSEK
jgi:hypothetical protein